MQTENSHNICSAVIAEFVEVAVHNILYTSNLYPENVFVRKKKYGIPVHMCIHPKINEYIKQCVHAIGHLLKLRQLFKIQCCFFDNKQLLCQFCFLFTAQDNISKWDPYFIKAEEYFREFCLRLSAQNYFKSPLSGDATFKIFLITTERASVEIAHNEEFQDSPFTRTEEMLGSQTLITPLAQVLPVGIQIFAETST